MIPGKHQRGCELDPMKCNAVRNLTSLKRENSFYAGLKKERVNILRSEIKKKATLKNQSGFLFYFLQVINRGNNHE